MDARVLLELSKRFKSYLMQFDLFSESTISVLLKAGEWNVFIILPSTSAVQFFICDPETN